MPTIFDMFGYPLTNRGEEVEASRKAKLCPFSGAVCDGGGNRSQTKIKLAQEEPLTSYFNHGIKDVVPGICSIHAAGDLWVVCPRRLLAFKHDGEGLPIVNSSLQTHEHDLLINVGLPRSVDIGIWSEVYLKLSGVDADTNYHFDYVAAPLKRGTLSQEAAIYGADATELGEVILNAKRGGWFDKGTKDYPNTQITLPDLASPYILEVMTSSTSGSDTEGGTDIRSAFRNAILGRDHEAPGINKRQVWGRMVTQLFAKTALADAWGGHTLWIIQDELLKNIELTTRLKTAYTPAYSKNNIHIAVMGYETSLKSGEAPSIVYKKIHTGDAGLDFAGNNTYTDILLPSQLPNKFELLKAMLRRELAAIVRL